jgi:hypothetical protein
LYSLTSRVFTQVHQVGVLAKVGQVSKYIECMHAQLRSWDGIAKRVFQMTQDLEGLRAGLRQDQIKGASSDAIVQLRVRQETTERLLKEISELISFICSLENTRLAAMDAFSKEQHQPLF